mmetsp:Transcript_19799/g.41725  ORF Transcript_19799/g.41725 Transcript_19799/m.41725 type:complete len:416 (-) Transcript_19799:71-1318(-)
MENTIWYTKTMVPKKCTTPAYKGARFDTEGFCVTHSSVRLCRITDNGQYKIVRKTCFKCGSAALMTEPHVQKTTAHGYKKKGVMQRDVPSELLRAGGHNAARGGGGDSGHSHNRDSKRIDPCRQGAGIVQDKQLQQRRRARTLSPRPSTITRRSPRERLFQSNILQKMSHGTMKGLIMDLKPPLFSNNFAAPSSSEQRPSKDNTTLSKQDNNKKTTTKCSEGVGHCRLHPQVQLGIRRTKLSDGKWEITKDVCPHCFLTTDNSTPSTPKPKTHKKKAIAPSSLKSSLKSSSNKSRALALTMATTTPPSTPRPTPPSPKITPKTPLCLTDDYFSSALVVYKEGSNSPSPPPPLYSPTSVSEDVMTVKYRNHNWAALPNSTARMARNNNNDRRKQKKNKEQQRQHHAYDAWESLPVC